MLFQRKSDGTGGEQLLTESANNKFPTSWSGDGRFIAYNSTPEGKSNSELWILPLFGDRKPFPFLETHSNVAEGRFCPRGGWIAYSSDESGRSEVYVTSFPGHQGKWQVSQSGGSMPRWRRDGKELFFFAADNHLQAVSVKISGTDFEVGQAQSLFAVSRKGVAIWRYDVLPDGQHFVVTASNQAAPANITLVTNWTSLLNRK